MSRLYAALAVLAVLLLVWVGFRGPSNAAWGVDALAFFPAGWRVVLGVLGLAGIGLALRLDRSGATRGAEGDAAAPATRKSTGHFLWALGAAAVAGVTFYLLRARTALHGRGYDILADLGRGEAASPVSWLYNLAAAALVRLQRAAGLPTVDEAGLVATLVGVVVVFLAVARGSTGGGGTGASGPDEAGSGGRAGAALVAILFATQGAAALFFGVVEAQALLAGAIVLFFLAARAAVTGRAGMSGVAAAFVLALLAHPFGWALAPAFVVTAALCPGPGRARRVLITGVGVAVVAGGLALAFALRPELARMGAPLAALDPQRISDLGARLAFASFDTENVDGLRSVLSAGHALDVANHLLLTAFPALLLLATLLAHPAGRRALVSPAALVALAAFLPFLALRLGTRTVLGPMRDWDHFAGVGVALTAWAAFAAAPLFSSSLYRGRAVVIVALTLGLVTLLPVIGIQAETERDVDRHLARVEGHPSLEAPVAAHYHATMGQRFLGMSRVDLAGNALERAWTAWPNAGTAWRAGLAFQAAGRLEKAAAAMTEVTAARPDDWRGWSELGNAWCGLGRFEAADAALRRAILLEPTAAAPRVHLARSLAMQGKSHEARGQLESARPLLEDRDPLRTDFELLDGQLPRGFVPGPP